MKNKKDNILRRWINENGFRLREISVFLNMNESNFSKILSGARNANPILAERILKLTKGAVQPNDLHRIRIEWLKENKPDVHFGLEPELKQPELKQRALKELEELDFEEADLKRAVERGCHG